MQTMKAAVLIPQHAIWFAEVLLLSSKIHFAIQNSCLGWEGSPADLFTQVTMASHLQIQKLH
jgi:hypothetical protein